MGFEQKNRAFSEQISFLNVGNLVRDNLVNVNTKLKYSFTCFCYDVVNGFIYIGDTRGHVLVFDVQSGK